MFKTNKKISFLTLILFSGLFLTELMHSTILPYQGNSQEQVPTLATFYLPVMEIDALELPEILAAKQVLQNSINMFEQASHIVRQLRQEGLNDEQAINNLIACDRNVRIAGARLYQAYIFAMQERGVQYGTA